VKDAHLLLVHNITPASKHLKGCHAGLDPASSLFNGFRHSPE
jgi:hypothetical protein